MTVGPFSLPDNDSSIPPSTVDPSTGEILSDYSTPSSSDLTSEASDKLSDQGNGGSFNNLSTTTTIIQQNGIIQAQDLNTGDITNTIGSYPIDSLPASAVPSSSTDNTANWKVKLVASPSLGNDTVTFLVTPQISETQSASYRGVGIIQHPGEILKYETTSARGFNLQVTLICRNAGEATTNLQSINLIRSWTMPFYGQGTANSYSDKLGAPPQIVTLSGYSDKIIPPTPCVVESWSWDWPEDVNYIPTSDGTPFPVVMKLNIVLKESRAPVEFSAFDLQAYRTGNIPAAFGGAVGNSNNSQSTTTGASTAGTNPKGIDTSQPATASTTQSQQNNSGPASSTATTDNTQYWG